MKTTQVLNSFKQYYQTEKFIEAQNLLLNNKELFEPNVYLFNLGLVEFRLENFSYSKLLLNKAQNMGFESEQSHELLKKIDLNLSLTRAQEPVTINDNLVFATQFIGSDILLIFSSILFIVFIIKIKEIYGVTLKIISLILLCLPLVWLINFKLNYADFVSLEDKEVREGPSRIFDDTFIMPKGIKYTISKKYKNWAFITYPNKYSGWIKISYEEKI